MPKRGSNDGYIPQGGAVPGAATNAAVNVGVASTAVVVANANRNFLTLVNDSVNVIYLALGAAAVVNSGIRLNANGGAIIIDADNMFTGAVNAIHGGAGVMVLTVCEG